MSYPSLRLAVLGGIILAIFVAPLSLAQTPDTQTTANSSSRAEALVQQGIEARRNGDDSRAVALFGQAYEINPNGRTVAQLGLAEQALGRFADAHAHLSEALESNHAWVAENREALESALSVVEQNVGRLEVLGGVTGARLMSNGAELGVFPLSEAVTLEVGSHSIEILADGYYPFARTVEIRPGQLSRLSVELRVRADSGGSDVSRDTDSAEERPDSGGSRPVIQEPATAESGPNTRGAGIALLSLGVASVAGGVASSIIREGAASDWNDDEVCLQGGLSRQENCGDKETRANRAGVIAGVLYGVGGAMVVVGAILIAVHGGDDEPEQALQPRCAPGFASLHCEMSF